MAPSQQEAGRMGRILERRSSLVAMLTPEGASYSRSQCKVLGLFMLLLMLGLTVMSWFLLAFMSGGCDGNACTREDQIVPDVPGSPLLSIFVSVASYRDPECKDTMQDIFSKAKHPERVFVGSVQQLATDIEEACWRPGLKWGQQIRSITVPFSEARGPTNARHLAATLYRNEDYFFQIDSHTTFRQDWDEHAIAMLDRCPSAKCFLSHYPPATGDPGLQVPVLCMSHFDEGAQMPSFEARNFDLQVGEFMESPFVGAGFQLSSADVLLEVPFDPKLDMLFVGEEILYSARLWTKGWDMYAPDMNLVWHHYNRSEHPNVFRDRTEEWWHPQQGANARARFLLGMNETAPPGETPSSLAFYGMGTARNLTDYWRYAQIDPWERVADSQQKFCHKHVRRRAALPGPQPAAGATDAAGQNATARKLLQPLLHRPSP